MDERIAKFPPTGLSGLSLPDARYEHTNIRAGAANLTADESKRFQRDLAGDAIVKTATGFQHLVYNPGI